MGLDCYCDGDPPEYYSAKRRVATQDLVGNCDECGRRIYKGEAYERACGKWEFGPEAFNTCTYCLAILDLIDSKISCFCREHGGLYEDVRNIEPDLAPGLAFAISSIRLERLKDAGRRRDYSR